MASHETPLPALDGVDVEGIKPVCENVESLAETAKRGPSRTIELANHLKHTALNTEKIVVRKFDWNVTSLVCVLYLLSYLDRSNIGNANIAGMSTDLNLSSSEYTWLLTIFYISFIVFEWLILMWKLLPPHIWATFVVVGWGLISTLQAATTSWAGMMVCRFFLGVVEAGLGLGVPYYLSFFYLRYELGFRCGIFLSMAPLASTFAGALAFGITSGHSTLPNWKLLFIIEGVPSIVLGAITFFCLPDTPEKARFLSEEQKVIARARGVRQVGEEAEHRLGHLRWSHVIEALLDWKNWVTAVMYFASNVSFSSLPVFLPLILKEMGFTAVNAQGLTAPPYFVSFVLTLATTYFADRLQQRGLTIMIMAAIGGIGYVILATTESVGPRYFGVFLAAGGIFPVIANTIPWVLNNQGSDTKRGSGITLLNIIGQCGPLLGTRIYPSQQGPFYKEGMSICAAFMFLTGILALGLRTGLAFENRRLNAQYGTRLAAGTIEMMHSEEEVKQFTAVGEENEGPMFRYIL